ncbi:ABC transporter permease [Phytoactinopolyspora mesophila]|uniref:ABC transporter permease n=1 Tax=Phytoactinopolyspora mesophila TaxID=2650750 RepID=A0A7K3LXE6_9ACTN|nr:ABC transporter permease [Phytoactinopolyspora mesophila]NDL55691.1 ABC transporter permease [Phytoactinopolyspora mesophila]
MAKTDTPQAVPVSTDRATADRTSIGQLFWQGGTVLALVALIAFFGVMRPDAFLTFANLRNLLLQIAILTIIAVAQTVVMVVGNFDLSVGTNATLSGATAAALMVGGTSMPVAIAIGLLVGTLVGVANGILVAFAGLSALVATLASMTTIGGLAFLVTDGTTLYGMPEAFGWFGQSRHLGIPMPVIFAAVIALVIWLVLRFSTTGRRWYAVGGSAEVARLSGINVRWMRFFAFTVAGSVAALGGIILVSRLGSASATSANNYMMLAVAAALLGMTVLKSGQANIGGTLVGVAIIGVMSNGLNIIGVNTYYQQVLTGLIIVAAVLLSALKTCSR